MPTSPDNKLVHRIADELEIRNLLNRVSNLNDRGTVDDYMDCWTEDALWDMPGAPRHGHAEIRAAFVERRQARDTGSRASSVRHVVTNQTLEIDDPDQATTESYLLYFRDTANGAIHQCPDSKRRHLPTHARRLEDCVSPNQIRLAGAGSGLTLIVTRASAQEAVQLG